MKVLVLFPHQLYFDLQGIQSQFDECILVEESLFFLQYKFHKQKLIFHRASMQNYISDLQQQGHKVTCIDSIQPHADVRLLFPWLKNKGVQQIILFEPDDFLLKKRILRHAALTEIELNWCPNQLFINTLEDLEQYKFKTTKLFQTDFYVYQRKLRNILLDENGGPLGGKWSFDAENRNKFPAKKSLPKSPSLEKNQFHVEAQRFVEVNFKENYGEINAAIFYPSNPQEARIWFQEFLDFRFAEFGEFEDSIVSHASFLHHSVLTPMLNVGLLKPMDVLRSAIDFAAKNNVPLNSLEGFVRQILGWREFVRYVYHFHNVKQRTTNFWGFQRKIPSSFYQGKTGIQPVDDAIKKLLNTAYNHHIERLMVLSNFMLLCEFDPDEVYRWFMEMYIDAYDWVMVPNVYGMAQFSDGGLMVTKPYISGSNYILKMSDYSKGKPWAEIWDALFWRFLSVNRDFFKKNPRLSMLINTFDKWPEEKKKSYLEKADVFLNAL